MVRDRGLVAESGWISVDRHTLEMRFPGVYAIGDVVAIPLTLGKPLPKAGWGGGNFYAEPKPEVTLRMPSRRWHLGKVWVEKSWLYTKL